MRPTLKALATERGIKYGTLRERLRRGWSLDRALSEPVQTDWSADVRGCSRWGEIKPTSEFIKLKRRSGNTYASHCRACDRLRTFLRRQQIRMEVLIHYSGDPPRCMLCGFDKTDCLDLDHIEGLPKQRLWDYSPKPSPSKLYGIIPQSPPAEALLPSGPAPASHGPFGSPTRRQGSPRSPS